MTTSSTPEEFPKIEAASPGDALRAMADWFDANPEYGFTVADVVRHHADPSEVQAFADRFGLIVHHKYETNHSWAVGGAASGLRYVVHSRYFGGQ